MKLSVCSNFQDDFLAFTEKYSEIKEVYSKLPSDYTGGGRPSFMVPKASKKTLRRLISGLKKQGKEFNYLINSTCMSNKELTLPGQKKIRKLLDFLAEEGTDSLTVSIPFIAEFIKKHYPQFKIKVSAFAGVSSIQQILLWQDLGIDAITLEPQTVNREFALLENMAKAASVPLQLIVNQGCMLFCPNVRYHSNLFSHSSHNRRGGDAFLIDYCSLKCRYHKLNDPVNFIRADWIRPEDTHLYEKIGIDSFKIIQRNWPTSKLELITKAYIDRHYDGNLADLSEFLFGNNKYLSTWRKIRYFVRPGKQKIFKLYNIASRLKNSNARLYIDNSELDGFIDLFIKESCSAKDCRTCMHCHKYAEKSLKLEHESTREIVDDALKLLKGE